jgi:hypothetical protein
MGESPDERFIAMKKLFCLLALMLLIALPALADAPVTEIVITSPRLEGQSVIRDEAAIQLILGLLLNSYWISVLYGSPYVPLLATRSIQCLVMMPIMYFTISALSKMLAGSKRRLL